LIWNLKKIYPVGRDEWGKGNIIEHQMKIVMLKETKTFKTLLRAYKEFRESNSSLHTMQVDVDDIISLVSKLYTVTRWHCQTYLPNIQPWTLDFLVWKVNKKKWHHSTCVLSFSWWKCLTMLPIGNIKYFPQARISGI
jgi:hypothetical protein